MRARTPALKVTDPQREVLETLSRSQTAAHRDVLIWTKTTDRIVEKVQRGRVTLNAITS
jgi:hypothetical protein